MSFNPIPKFVPAAPTLTRDPQTAEVLESHTNSIFAAIDFTKLIENGSKLEQHGEFEMTKKRLVEDVLQQAAAELETELGTLESNDMDQIVQNPKFHEKMSAVFLKIFTSIIDEAEKLPPCLIAEADMNEAAFSHALAARPIVATDSLGPCIGIAGYARENKWGFVFHIATDKDLEASKGMLLEKIKKMGGHARPCPIELHLRGGIESVSEPLVEALEKWVQEANEKGIPLQIVSKEALRKKTFDTSGIAPSISLDTRDGTVSIYERSTNPYAKPFVQIKSAEEAEELITNYIIQNLGKKPEIKVVYFP